MDTLICPHCKKTVEISEAISHQIEERILSDITEKHKQELIGIKKEAEEKATQKIKDELSVKLKDAEEQAISSREKNKELRVELMTLMKQMREMQEKDDKREIEMEKKLLEERKKLAEDLKKDILEKTELEKQDLRKQLEDTKKLLEDARNKAEQKSQQLQGEVLELELERTLASSFPDDDVIAIGKGVLGADIRHVVKSPRGIVCGELLWELKRAKEWDKEWIPKLKEDMRAAKANNAIIVSTVFPKDFQGPFVQKEGVIVATIASALPVALLLRKNLLDVGYQKAVAANRGTKADLVYTYVTSHEFQQQVENAVEAYQEIAQQIQKERAT
ncbi:MAG: DUF2130 domain-containing protein, partial [bacterium]|nr:DUF2130 domain-containing protein [bacterium]